MKFQTKKIIAVMVIAAASIPAMSQAGTLGKKLATGTGTVLVTAPYAATLKWTNAAKSFESDQNLNGVVVGSWTITNTGGAEFTPVLVCDSLDPSGKFCVASNSSGVKQYLSSEGGNKFFDSTVSGYVSDKPLKPSESWSFNMTPFAFSGAVKWEASSYTIPASVYVYNA